MNLKCLVPLFFKTILTKINDLVVGTHSLANETFSSFYNSEHQDGIIMKTTKCVIDYTYKFLNSHLQLNLVKILLQLYVWRMKIYY